MAHLDRSEVEKGKTTKGEYNEEIGNCYVVPVSIHTYDCLAHYWLRLSGEGKESCDRIGCRCRDYRHQGVGDVVDGKQEREYCGVEQEKCCQLEALKRSYLVRDLLSAILPRGKRLRLMVVSP